MFDPTNGCTSAASGTVTVTDPASVTLNLLDDAINIDLGESGTIDLTANDNTTNAGAIQEIMMSNNISYTFMNGVIDYTGITVGVDTISYSSCDVVCYNICDSAIVSVTVREVIPFTAGNFGLSPNGDGNGDELVFPGLENADDSQITLVNRWGDIVYSEAPYSNNWAGINSDGTALSNGTYYYVLIVTFAGEQTEHTGYIEIIK
jgi:gliding motility-associated-like protein